MEKKTAILGPFWCWKSHVSAWNESLLLGHDMLPRPCLGWRIPTLFLTTLWYIQVNKVTHPVLAQGWTLPLAHHGSLSLGMSPHRCISKAGVSWRHGTCTGYGVVIQVNEQVCTAEFKFCSCSVWNHYLLVIRCSAVAHQSWSAFMVVSVLSCGKTNKKICS